jgi:hypothetical protein
VEMMLVNAREGLENRMMGDRADGAGKTIRRALS